MRIMERQRSPKACIESIAVSLLSGGVSPAKQKGPATMCTGAVTSTSGGGSSSASSSNSGTPSNSIFGRVSGGGLFGGLAAIFNTSSVNPEPMTTVATAAPVAAPSAAAPANSVRHASPALPVSVHCTDGELPCAQGVDSHMYARGL